MRLLLSILLLSCILNCNGQDPKETKNKEVVFRGVNVIPMDKEVLLMDQTVVVKNGKITQVGDAKQIKYSKDAVVIDGTGKYLMPGLAEMHAHVPPVDNIEPMKEVLTLFALNGITTIRGMLGHPRHLELRSKINSGEIFGPRFITSGPSFNGNTIKTPEAARDSVTKQKKAGYDFLKLHPGLTKENFAAIVKTAKEVGIPFAGHVSWDVGVWRAIDAGYATIDHLDGFVESLVPDIASVSEQDAGLFGIFLMDKVDPSRIEPLVKGLKEHSIWVVPTQSLAERWMSPDKDAEALGQEPEMVYMSPDLVKNWVNNKKGLVSNPKYDKASVANYVKLRRRLIYECNKAGVGILLGSDAPQVFDVPGFSAHHELGYMVASGLSPYEALRTGTYNVGAFLKRPDIGVIKPGATADLILLNGNPLKDINQTRNIEGVLLNNQWMSRGYIAETLAKLKKG